MYKAWNRIFLSIVLISTPSLALSNPKLVTQPLYKSIEVGDLEKAKVLLNDVDVNSQDSSGYTPLYKAVFYNHLDLVKYLFELGAKPNLSDVEGLTPLHVAAIENLPHMIETLRKEGANIETKDYYGYTPLHLAADQGNYDSALKLIDYRANVNSRSEWGGTPLHASVAKKNIHLIRLLIANGAQLG